MRKFISKVKETEEKVVGKIILTKAVINNKCGEGFVDTAIKILMAVVIGALVLAGLYKLFDDIVMPTLNKKVTDLFDYKG